jgi:hypothetical protein
MATIARSIDGHGTIDTPLNPLSRGEFGSDRFVVMM